MRNFINLCYMIIAVVSCLVNSQSTSAPAAADDVFDKIRLERLEKELWELRRQFEEMPLSSQAANVNNSCSSACNYTAVAMSCQDILNLHNTSASGEYTLVTKSGTTIDKAYCEMGLNGGGYMFLTAQSLADLTNNDIQAMFTDKSSLLMRIRKTDGTQRYAVLEQLSQYSQNNVIVHKDGFPADYYAPVNSVAIGSQFLYFALLPTTPQRDRPGVKVNKVEVTYEHCGPVMASLFAFFPNFKERTQAHSDSNFYRYPFLESIFNNTRLNPSFRGLPEAYYMFTEIHFGACGVYTDSFAMHVLNEVTGIAMGFR